MSLDASVLDGAFLTLHTGISSNWAMDNKQEVRACSPIGSVGNELTISPSSSISSRPCIVALRRDVVSLFLPKVRSQRNSVLHKTDLTWHWITDYSTRYRY